MYEDPHIAKLKIFSGYYPIFYATIGIDETS